MKARDVNGRFLDDKTCSIGEKIKESEFRENARNIRVSSNAQSPDYS
jgi:hypothetical protein